MLEIIRTAAPYKNISKQCSLLQTNFYCKREIVMTKGNIYTPWCPNVQHIIYIYIYIYIYIIYIYYILYICNYLYVRQSDNQQTQSQHTKNTV